MYTILTYNAGETTWTIADFLNCVQVIWIFARIKNK